MQTLPLLGAFIFKIGAPDLVAGAVCGVAAAAAIASTWSHYGRRVPFTVFLHVTAVFLLLFVAQLLMIALHDLVAAGLLPRSDALRGAVEPFGREGVYGRYLGYLLLVAPLAWLLIALFWGHGKASDDRLAQMGQ